MTAVETQRLSKRYRRVWALRDCSVNVGAGRVVALVGPNGAGKTTLLHAVAGLVTPTAGTLRVFSALPGTPRALVDVAFAAQDKPLYDSFRVAELIELARRLNPRWDNTFALSRLAALEIPLRRRAGRLSGGQQAQVAITLALAKRPRLLLLDEPLANLDPLARADLMREVMGSVAHSGTTVILSSHAIADLVPVCDWLIVLNRGGVQISGEIDGLLTSHQALTGPATAGDPLAGPVTVVGHSRSGQLSHLLVRGTAAITDPRWTSRPVGLEELVLAYLREPGASALPAPVLTTIEGGR